VKEERGRCCRQREGGGGGEIAGATRLDSTRLDSTRLERPLAEQRRGSLNLVTAELFHRWSAAGGCRGIVDELEYQRLVLRFGKLRGPTKQRITDRRGDDDRNRTEL
jgi:hypothetical protein